jgi:acetyl esterase/lipase
MKYTITLFFLQLLTYSYGQNDIRYISKIFNDYNLYQNITYEEAIPYNIEGIKAIKSYKLDFYEPFGDDVSSRPLVLLFPDGNFIAGNKEQDEIVNWCRTLTTYGYTCACVNYRQGYDNTIPKDGINQATFRAVQDGRAAIRFFIEHQDAFRINTDKIFLGGYKTGAEVALQTAFIDKEEEYPNWLGTVTK